MEKGLSNNTHSTRLVRHPVSERFNGPKQPFLPSEHGAHRAETKGSTQEQPTNL